MDTFAYRSWQPPPVGELAGGLAYGVVPGWLRNLVAIYAITWFIPYHVNFFVGSLTITPQKVVGIILFFYLVGGNRIRWCWIDLVALGPFVTNFVCTSLSSGTGRAVESTGRMMLDLWISFLIGRYIAQNPSIMIWFVRFVIRCLAVLSPFLAIESIFRFNIHCAVWNVPYAPMTEMRFGLTRAYGWTLHPIMLGISYGAFAAPALALAIERGKEAFRRRLYFFLILVGVLFSLSTGGWCVAFIAIMFLLWDRLGPGRRKQRWLTAAVCVIGFYLAVVLFADNPPMMVALYHINFLSSGWLYRWQLWDRVYAVMPGHWMLGYGEAIPAEFRGPVGWSVDNHYLLLLLTQGWFGLATWLAYASAALWRSIRTYWLRGKGVYFDTQRGLGFTIVGFLAAGLTVGIMDTAAVMFYFIAGAASTNLSRSSQVRSR